jgi:predicted small integral membrane protein
MTDAVGTILLVWIGVALGVGGPWAIYWMLKTWKRQRKRRVRW